MSMILLILKFCSQPLNKKVKIIKVCDVFFAQYETSELEAG